VASSAPGAPPGSPAGRSRGSSVRLAGAWLLLAAYMLLACAPPAAAQPLPPRDVYGEAKRADEVTLSWKPGTDQPGSADHYLVVRDGVQVADTPALSFTDRWLLERHSYSYVVIAVNDRGESAAAAPVAVATPVSHAFEIGPYLQQAQSTKTAIVWQTYDPATTALHFGPVGGPLRTVERDLTLTRRHVVWLRDLVPGTAYEYRWESDGRLSERFSFRTPVVKPASLTFGVIGDFGIGSAAARANLRRLSEDPSIDLALTTGDNAQIYGTEAEYRDFVLGPLRGLITQRPFWPSVGNHDYYNIQNYERFFALPNQGKYYSFTYGGVLFMALDSYRFGPRQRRWARKTLARSRSRCKVAYFHHPLWSSGPGYRSHRRHLRRGYFVPILQRGGVDLVLNGHVQNYERSKPLWSGRRSRRRGITYVVTGGGGARLNGFVTRRKPRWSAKRGVFFHRLRIRVSRHVFFGRAIDDRGNTRDRFRAPCRR
jgi:calcineurin-like phosphoesterase family protein